VAVTWGQRQLDEAIKVRGGSCRLTTGVGLLDRLQGVEPGIVPDHHQVSPDTALAASLVKAHKPSLVANRGRSANVVLNDTTTRVTGRIVPFRGRFTQDMANLATSWGSNSVHVIDLKFAGFKPA
jgi:hypothetical protein